MWKRPVRDLKVWASILWRNQMMVKWRDWLLSRILTITGLKYWTVTIWLNHFKAILKWYIQHWTDTIKLNLANWHFEASDNYLPECWVDFRSNFKIRKYLPLQGRMYPRGNFLWDLCDGRPVRWWAESAPSHWLNSSDAGTGGARRATAPQYLADRLTLFQPWGAYSAHPLLLAPPMFFTFRYHCS